MPKAIENSNLTSIRVLSLKEEGERETKHENDYSLRERLGLLWHKVGMGIKHKDESVKSIRELSLNPRNMLSKWHPRPPFYSKSYGLGFM